jgi:hypothetical protein
MQFSGLVFANTRILMTLIVFTAHSAARTPHVPINAGEQMDLHVLAPPTSEQPAKCVAKKLSCTVLDGGCRVSLH